MAVSESNSELVLDLAEEFIARYRKGERPPLREYIDRHPELAEEIKDVFPAMAMMENIAVADESIEGPAVKVKAPPAAFKQLGDYRIVREIGHGGMGVVYEAEQLSLGRHVALKLLPNHALHDAKQKRRFEREAKAAAKLHHTNIVPVFGVGEHEGVPYYVMQFIQGMGLDAVLEELNRLRPGSEKKSSTGVPTAGEMRVSRRDVSAAEVARSLMTGTFQWSSDPEVDGIQARLPFEATADQRAEGEPLPTDPSSSISGTRLSDSLTVSSSSITLPGKSGERRNAGRKQSYWQSVANIGLQVAEALEYAHKQGIQHRDVKPSNLLLDLRGTVWVTDFGLAKLAGPDGDNLTHTGDILGTLRYMPPEAFEGISDARSDVYSLGLTLYELLAMRPAFAEKDRNKLVKQVTTGEPTPLDKVRREVPRDLVTIVQKSIAREPSRRYATAEDLASDLQRFLDDEPIQARRQTHVERYVRWARHHPSIAVLGGVLTAVLVLATVASLVVASRMASLASNAMQAAEDERMARKQAVEAQEREADQRGKAEGAKKTAEESKQQADEALKKALKAEEEAKAEGRRADKEAETAQQNLYYAQMHLAQPTWREPLGLPPLRRLLKNWLPEDESPDRRGWEWFYLNSLPYQHLRTLVEGTNAGNGYRPCLVAWHSPSKRLAAGDADGVIRIWDVERERTIRTLRGPAPAHNWCGITWFAWSPNGKHLAAGCKDGTIHLWDTDAGRRLRVLKRDASAIMSVSYSSDGMRVAAWTLNGRIRIWDAESGQFIRERFHPGGLYSGAWSPDDKQLASGHKDGSVTISGIDPADKLITLRGHASTVFRLAWSPDGERIVSSSEDFTSKIWDVASQKVVVGPLRHSHSVTSLAWEPGGKKLATGSADQSVKVWNAATGHEEFTLRGHSGKNVSVSGLAWSADGRLASGGSDDSVRIWHPIRDQESSRLPGHAVGTNAVRATTVAWSPDGTLLASGGDDGKIRIWDQATHAEVLAIQAHNSSRVNGQFGLMRSLAWSSDSKRIASAGLDGSAKIWDVASGKESYALPADHGWVWSVAWSPDGAQLAAGTQDGTIQIVELLKDPPAVRVIKAHEPILFGAAGSHGVRTLAWSHKGDLLASGGVDGQVKIWDPKRGAELGRMQTGSWILGVTWSPDGKRLASASVNALVTIWDVETRQRFATMRGHNTWVDAVSWSPDGTRLASGALDNTVRISDPRTGEETFVLRGDAGFFHEVAWHRDGAQLAAANSDGQIWIWDATRGYERDTTAKGLPYLDRLAASGAARGEDIRWCAESYLRAGRPKQALAVVKNDRESISGLHAKLTEDEQTAFVELWADAARTSEPANNAERIERAQIAYDFKKFAYSARMWTEAAKSDPKLGDDRETLYRDSAARAAARAAAGQGLNEPALDDVAKTTLRRQALDLLRAELAASAALLKSGPTDERATVVQALSLWLSDSDFTGLREPAALAKLPADEAAAFRQLWGGVTELLRFEPRETTDPKQFAALLGAIAPGFTTDAVGEKGLALLKEHFGRPLVIQTHPILPGVPCILKRTIELPAGERSKLRLSVAHHELGDWQLIVKANGQQLHDSIIGPATTKNGWADIEIDLSRFAGKKVRLELHNHPNNWYYEWGYWGRIEIVSDRVMVKRFPAVIRGEDKPKDNSERLAFAQIAFDQKKFAFAVGLWTEALESDPKLGDDRLCEHRYGAARAAALAASGQGLDEPLDDAAKAKFRGKAIGWLRSELGAWSKMLDSRPELEQETIASKLNGWKHDSALAGLWDVAALARLPQDEQKALTQLWTDVAASVKAVHARHGALLIQQVAEARKQLDKDSPELAYLLAQVGKAFLEQEEWQKAEPYLRECLTIREKVTPESWATFNTYSSLGGALLGQKKYAEAEPFLLKGYRGMKEREKVIPAIGKECLPEALDRLIDFYSATNKPNEVKKWQGERGAKMPETTAPDEMK